MKRTKGRRKTILYLFRRPAKKDIENTKIFEYPHDFFYGFTKITKSYNTEVSDKVFTNRLVGGLDQLLIKMLLPKIKTGVSFFSVLYQKKEIDKSDLVFCTVDTCGIPYAFFYFVKFFRTPFVFNTIGLCDALIESRSKIFKTICSAILKNSQNIVSGASFYECKKMAKILNLPLTKFSFVPFGIDINYFSPGEKTARNFILIIGADPKRDWNLYYKIIKALPKMKFVIITNKKVFEDKLPNVEMFYNLPIGKVREFIRNCRLMLILSKQNYHFAGQSTILRGMSCQKTVIFTKSYGTEEYGFVNYQNGIFISPNKANETVKVLKKVYKKDDMLFSIGKAARKMIVQKYGIDQYSRNLTEVFKKSIAQ